MNILKRIGKLKKRRLNPKVNQLTLLFEKLPVFPQRKESRLVILMLRNSVCEKKLILNNPNNR